MAKSRTEAFRAGRATNLTTRPSNSHGFVVSVDTPQFFPSSVSIIALLETLLSFVIAVASDRIVARVETFHKRRHQLGLYHTDTP